MASPSTKTDICNMALNRIGAKAVTAAQITADTDPRAQDCNRHYDQTRDALIRSHWWRFASDRVALVVTTTPAFEWAYAFTLPTNFLRMKSIYEDNNTTNKTSLLPYALEDKILLFSESACQIRYIKQVTTVTDFDPLFIETFILQLALKLIPPRAGVGAAGQGLLREIKDELYGKGGVMERVRTMDRQETNTIPPNFLLSWQGSRLTNAGRIDSKLGSP